MKRELFDSLCSSGLESLEKKDYAVIDGVLSEQELTAMIAFFDRQWSENVFRLAGIGADLNFEKNAGIRNDKIKWLETEEYDLPVLQPFFQFLEQFIEAFVPFFRLSVNDYEFHFARYDVGHFYKKHLDQFNNRSNRVISVILYLNEQWQPGDGGELRLWHDEERLDIAPLGGRIVLLRSDLVWHEVLPARFIRRSLTGWLTRKPLGLGYL